MQVFNQATLSGFYEGSSRSTLSRVLEEPSWKICNAGEVIVVEPVQCLGTADWLGQQIGRPILLHWGPGVLSKTRLKS